MIEWVSKQLAFAIHDRLRAEHGGSDGVRDESLVESALGRPQQFYACTQPAPDLADLAAMLAYGLACIRPFVGGNKRTAYACCETFIELNDAEVDAALEDKCLIILALADGRLDQDEYAAWLRGRMRKRDSGAKKPPPRQAGTGRRAARRS